ncbi:MAG: tRNA-dependent cyclodipeptide synthase [Bacteroidota bacterium]
MNNIYKARIPQEILANKGDCGCFLSISMANNNQTGVKLSSTLEWINNNFSFCIVNLADSIQQHNFEMLGLPYSQALQHAKRLGDRWLKENGEILEELEIPYSLTRWDNWRCSSSLQPIIRKYQKLYETNAQFSHTLNKDLQAFVDKHYSQERHPISRERYFAGCIDYFFEELSVWTIVGRTGRFIKIYPARPHKVAVDLSNGLYEAPNGIENITFARLSFKKRSQALLKAA